YATIAGGQNNKTIAQFGTVGGGFDNTASGAYATLGGGKSSFSLGYAATVPGGELNAAVGNHSFAAGHRAKANHAGTFVWSCEETSDFASTALNQFLIRADGGAGLGAAPASGAALHIAEPLGTPPSTVAPGADGLLFGVSGRNAYKWIQSYSGSL